MNNQMKLRINEVKYNMCIDDEFLNSREPYNPTNLFNSLYNLYNKSDDYKEMQYIVNEVKKVTRLIENGIVFIKLLKNKRRSNDIQMKINSYQMNIVKIHI